MVIVQWELAYTEQTLKGGAQTILSRLLSRPCNAIIHCVSGHHPRCLTEVPHGRSHVRTGLPACSWLMAIISILSTESLITVRMHALVAAKFAAPVTSSHLQGNATPLEFIGTVQCKSKDSVGCGSACSPLREECKVGQAQESTRRSIHRAHCQGAAPGALQV